MARRVRWTPGALKDLDEIAAYIARDSRFYAAIYVRRMFAASRSLSTLPMRARIVPEVGEVNLRELLIGNYRLIFRLFELEIQIITVINQTRDLSIHLSR